MILLPTIEDYPQFWNLWQKLLTPNSANDIPFAQFHFFAQAEWIAKVWQQWKQAI